MGASLPVVLRYATPEYSKTPVCLFKNYSGYFCILVQKNAFFCTKQLILLYRRYNCFVQHCINLPPEIEKLTREFK